MDAFAFIGAESTAWVWPDTIPLSTHRANTLLNNVPKGMPDRALPRPADGRVPWQALVYVKTQKVEHVHSHTAMFHQFPVGGDVLQVSRDQQLKRDNGVDRGVAGPAIEFPRILIEKTQVKRFEKPSVKIFLWDPVR